MARPRKYEFGTETMSLSLPKEVLEVLRKRAETSGKSLSSFAALILKMAVFNDSEYAKLMAKHYNKQMQYWLSESERLKIDKKIEMEV